jgi:hypothetical protein
MTNVEIKTKFGGSDWFSSHQGRQVLLKGGNLS